MFIDVTDATFQAEVIERSMTTPVVVDLWAEWCGPCKTLGPILEKVVDATRGQVVLAKVDVDANQQVAAAFRVQSIPAVYAIANGQVVDAFMGAEPEHVVAEFVARLLPSEESQTVRKLIEAGDEESLRVALSMEPGNHDAVIAMAQLLVKTDRAPEALQLLARIPETDNVRRVAAAARLAADPVDDFDAQLTTLLDTVKA
ncbi:MAG: thioredoxin domain-containing protein, partial [Actinomycetota bacterium]